MYNYIIILLWLPNTYLTHENDECSKVEFNSKDASVTNHN